MFSSSAPAGSFAANNGRKKKTASEARLPPISRPVTGERCNTAGSAAGRCASRTSIACSTPLFRGSAVGGLTAKKYSAWYRVLRQRAQGRELARTEGNVLVGIKELLKALSLQAFTPGGLLDPVGVTSKGVVPPGMPAVEPAWLCAEEVVHLANEKAVLDSATAVPQEEINPYLKEALKLVCGPEDDLAEMLEGDCLNIVGLASSNGNNNSTDADAGPASTGLSSRRRTVTIAARSGSVARGGSGGSRASAMSTQHANYFQSFPQLRTILCAVILNTVAVAMQAAGRPQAEILRVLMRALVSCHGVFGTGVLYNIAVTHAAMGQMDESLKAASRCADLCTTYLNVDPRGEAETELEAAELADTYSTFVVAAATHMVACQLLMASLHAHMAEASPSTAATSAELERQHCQQAATCAAVFLPTTHPLQRRTAARLSAAESRFAGYNLAAQAREHADVPESDDSSLPPLPAPQFPLMALHIEYTFSASPMISEVPALSFEAPRRSGEWAFDGSAAADGATADAAVSATASAADLHLAAAYASTSAKPTFESVTLGRLTLLWGSVKVPAKLRRYIASLNKVLALHHRKREAAAAAAANNARARRRSASRSSGSVRRTPTASSAGSRAGSPALLRQQAASPADAALTPRPPSSPPVCCGSTHGGLSTPRLTDSVVPPLIVTEVPRAAFNRYRALKQAALCYLDGITAATEAPGEAAEVEGASTPAFSQRVATPTPPSGAATTRAASPFPGREKSPRGRSRRLSTLYYSVKSGRDGVRSQSPSEQLLNSSPTRVRGDPFPNAVLKSAALSTNAEELLSNEACDAAQLVGELTEMKPCEQMRTMDTELLRYSKVVVDLLPEIRYAAACKIQQRWQCYQMFVERCRRAAAVEQWRLKSEAAAVVLRAYRNYKACKPAKEELHRWQDERKRMMQATLIQQYVYEKQSVEEWGRRCVALYQRRLAEKARRELEETSAMMMQSWWRMARVRADYQKRRSAALSLECAWRVFLARKETTRRRVLKRLAYEEFLRQNYAKILYIQRWYRACKSRIAVNGLLSSRQQAVATYLENMTREFNECLGPLANDLARTGGALERVLSVLHGARARALMHARHVAMERVRGCLRRWVNRTRGLALLDALREEHQTALRQQRRREEVLDAALRIQGLARRWLRSHQPNSEQSRDALLHRSASIIQSAYRTHVQRREGSTLDEWRRRQELQERTAHMLQLREYSASKIQATYRMYRTRRDNAEYLQFMLVDRHTMARRIQRCWSLYLARRTADQRRLFLEDVAHCHQQDAVECVAVVRIQSVIRMFLVRCRLLREWQASCGAGGAVSGIAMGWRTPYQRFAAARAIQTAWRGCASRWYVRQVRFAKARYATERTTLESLYAYATIIQKMVRAKLLNRKDARDNCNVPRDAEVGISPLHRPICSATLRQTGEEAAMVERQLATRPVSLSRPSTAFLSTHTPKELVMLSFDQAELNGSSNDEEEVSTIDSAPSAEAHTRERQTAAFRIQRIWRRYWTRRQCDLRNEVLAGASTALHDEEDEEDDRAQFPTRAPSSRDANGSLQRHELTQRSGSGSSSRWHNSNGSTTTTMTTTTRRSTSESAGIATTTTTTTTTTQVTTTVFSKKVSVDAVFSTAAQEAAESRPSIESYTPEQHAAATMIQKMWRGYVVRCTYEFYYEEYEEEVTVSDESDDDS